MSDEEYVCMECGECFGLDYLDENDVCYECKENNGFPKH